MTCARKHYNRLPCLTSSSLKNAHAEPVWSVAWVDKGEDKGEVLVTASTDGRVLEWTLSKGLEASCLMVLKQLGDAEGVISRTASGLCLDIPGDDPALYLTACEDGTIHKRSDAYAEQYLESYTGHGDPCIKWWRSPLRPQGLFVVFGGLDRQVVDAGFFISISVVPERRVVSTK